MVKIENKIIPKQYVIVPQVLYMRFWVLEGKMSFYSIIDN